MVSLLGGEVAALLPGMAGVAPAEAASGTAPLPFAELLNGALDGLAAPDAATLALMSPLLNMPTSVPIPETVAMPLPIVVLNEGLPVDGVAASPLSGNELPPDGQEIPQLAAATLPLSQQVKALEVRYEAISIDAERKQTLLKETALSLASSMPKSEASARGTDSRDMADEVELALPEKRDLPSANVLANTSNNTAQRDSRNDERAAQSQQKNAVLDSIAALSGALTPFKAQEGGAALDNLPTTMLPAISTATEAVTFNPENSVPVTGSISSPAVAGTMPKAEFSIPQSPQQPGWGEAFGERVTFMVKQNLQEAEIRLNPPQLGQIDVRVSFANDQASLVFSSPHAAVRDAIETSMVRLRELLGESGISLGNVDVSDKSLAQQHKGAESERDLNRDSAWNGYRSDLLLADNAGEILGASGNGRIDYFV